MEFLGICSSNFGVGTFAVFIRKSCGYNSCFPVNFVFGPPPNTSLSKIEGEHAQLPTGGSDWFVSSQSALPCLCLELRLPTCSPASFSAGEASSSTTLFWNVFFSHQSLKGCNSEGPCDFLRFLGFYLSEIIEGIHGIGPECEIFQRFFWFNGRLKCKTLVAFDICESSLTLPDASNAPCNSLDLFVRWLEKIKAGVLQEETGWWLNQPIWKICSSKWESSPNMGENKTYLKPPIFLIKRLGSVDYNPQGIPHL